MSAYHILAMKMHIVSMSRVRINVPATLVMKATDTNVEVHFGTLNRILLMGYPSNTNCIGNKISTSKIYCTTFLDLSQTR